MNRRAFLKVTSISAVALAFGSQLLALGQRAWAAAALALVDMSKTKRKDPENEKAVGILAGLGYVEDAVAAEKAGKYKRVDKNHPSGKPMPAAKQFCSNCSFFEDAKVDTKDHAKCKLVPVEIQVHSKGICNTYNAHPKSKV